METKFEATYVRDEKFAKEFYSYYAYKRPVGIFVTIVCIVVIAYGIIDILSADYYFAALSIVLGVYVLGLRAIRVKNAIKVSLERDKETNHGNFVELTNTVTENSIFIKTSINEGITEYAMSSVKKLCRSKNYIYLVTEAKLVIVFDINAFSVGTPEEFVEFIRSKGIKTQ